MNKVLLLVFFSLLTLHVSFAGTIYYSQVSAGGGRDVTQLANWKTSIGGGTSPASFLAGDEFHIVSADSMMASAAWLIPGAKLVIENGKFTSSGFSHSFTLDMQASGYYYHSSGIYTNVSFGILDSNSGFEFRGGTFIPSKIYPNLIVNTGLSFPVNGNLVVQGSLTVNNTSNFIFAYTAGATVTVTKDFNLTKGTVVCATGTFSNTFSVGGNINMSGGLLTLSQSSGSFSLNLAGNLNFSGGTLYIAKGSGAVSLSITGNFNMTGGILIGVSSPGTSNPQVSVGGNLKTAGSYYAQSGGTGIITYLLSGTGTVTMGSVNNNNHSITVTGTYALASNVPIGKDLLLNGGSLSIGSNTLSLYGQFNVSSGTLTGGATSNLSFLSPSSSNANLPSITLQSLVVTRPSQTISMVGDVTVGSSLTISAGTLSIGNNTFTFNGVLNPSSGTLLGGPTSNVVWSGSSYTNFPSVDVNNLTINKIPSTVTVGMNGPITVGGTLNLTSGTILTNSQTLTIGNGATIIRNVGKIASTPTFAGFYNLSYIGSIAVTTGPELSNSLPNALDNLTITNTGSVTLNKNFEVNQVININSGGVLNASTYTIQADGDWINNATFNPGTGTVNFYGTSTISGTPVGSHGFYNMTIGAGATLTAPLSDNINVSRSLITGATSTFNHNNGTVTFTGSVSQTIPALDYYNLASTSTGTRVLASSGTIGIAGSFTPGTNTYTTTGSTVNFNGSSAQNIPVFTFNNLTVSGANVKTLNLGNATVNGILSFSNGVISTGVNKVIIGTSGSVTGAGSGNYVNGFLQKNFAIGSNVSRTFEIGNSSNYLPMTVSFATVSVAGNITANTTDGDHAQIASSCIDATKSVNRYWTLTNSGVSPVNYGVVLNFAASDIDGGANFNNFEGALYNGSSWLNLTSGSKTSTSITLTGATTFGSFQLGETNAPVSVSIAVNPGTTICTGTSVTFTAVPVNGGASPTYQWKKNNVNTNTGTTYVDNGLVNSDVISVDMVSNSPCAFNPNATASVTMIVNTASTPTITPGGPTTFCSGGSVTLTSSAGVSYLWSTGATTSSIVASTGGSYSVTITDVNGCQATSAAIVVTVNSASIPTITPSGPTTLCSGGSVTLTSSAGVSYLWSTGATTSSIIVSTSGSDSVTITDVNGCQGTSVPTVVTVNSCTFTWNGSADTDWNNGSNWDIGFAPDSLGDVVISSSAAQMPALTGNAQARSFTINSGAIFTLNAASTFNVFGDFTNNGTFTDNGGTSIFKSSSNQTLTGVTAFNNLTLNGTGGLTLASLTTVNGIVSLIKGTLTSGGNLVVDLNTGAVAYNTTDLGSISGNIKVQKNVAGSGTHFIACPLSGVTANDLNDDTPVKNGSSTRLATWNGTTYSYTGITDLNTPLVRNTGYNLFFTVTSTVLDYTGSYNHNASPFSITASHADSVSILVGNPYPSALDWYAASGWTKTNLDDVVAYYQGANHRYVYFLNGVSINGGTQYIPALQGFWVKRTGSSGSSTIGLDNRTRVSNQNPPLWRTGTLSNYLKITAGIDGREDEALVRFDENATEFYDQHFDAFKLINPDSTPSVFTSDQNHTYSINTSPAGNKVIALNLKAGFTGIHTITVEGSESFDAPCQVILEDKLLNVRKEIKGKTQYNCNVNEGDKTDRFNLRVTYNVNSTNNTNGKVLIGSFDKTINFNFNNAGNAASLNIYNLMGQQVGSIENADISSGIYSYTNSKLSEGIYVVKVSMGNDIYTAKVYIK